MTETFAPPKDPAIGARKTSNYRVKTADFGDGYVQRAQDGINAKTVSWDLEWDGIPNEDADAIEAFFDSVGGYQSFYYNVPGDIQRKYTNGPVVRAYSVSGMSSNITVTLTESHNP